MHELQSLAIIWTAVLAAHFLAAKTRLTPVLWFLAAGCLLANTGVIPSQPGEFIRGMSEVGIIVITVNHSSTINIECWSPVTISIKSC